MLGYFKQKDSNHENTSAMSFFTTILLSVISGGMFVLSYPDFNFYFLTWFFLIPLFVALNGISIGHSYLLGLITGTVIVTGGMHWQSHLAVNFMDWPRPLNAFFPLLYGLAIGQLFGFATALWQWIKKRTEFNDLFIFPVLLTAIWSIYPMVFYFRLGGSQSYFLTAIQAIEFTGIYGLDFIIVLTNVLFYKLMTGGRMMLKQVLFSVGVAIVFIWFSWGAYSLSSWKHEVQKWSTQKIGIVQPNRVASLAKKRPDQGYTYTWPREMEKTRELAKAGAKLVVWPEGHFYGYSYWTQVRTAFKKHIDLFGVDLLFQDTTFEQTGKNRKYYNSAIMLYKDREKADIYHKNILVPFGEYIPFLRDIPWLNDMLQVGFVQLYAGKDPATFETGDMRVTPLICYESIFPEYSANALMNDPVGKIIIVGSQDGWYGWRKAVEQHNVSTVLRAVENRVPLIHVLYNGFSSAVLPTGEYVFVSEYMKEGGWTFDLPYNRNSGGSWYTYHPYLFINIVRFIAVLMIVSALLKKPFSKTKFVS